MTGYEPIKDASGGIIGVYYAVSKSRADGYHSPRSEHQGGLLAQTFRPGSAAPSATPVGAGAVAVRLPGRNQAPAAWIKL
jgi:hypothetical protein